MNTFVCAVCYFLMVFQANMFAGLGFQESIKPTPADNFSSVTGRVFATSRAGDLKPARMVRVYLLDKASARAYVTITVSLLQHTSDERVPANADHPVGLSHVGIWADDLKTTVTALRQQGVKVDDPRPGATKAPLTNVVDPNGVRLELLDFAPESFQRKAIDAWR